MNSTFHQHFSDEWIINKRGRKHEVDPFNPYAYLIEKEFMHTGVVEDVLTIFLTNRECPFKCLMCDLWKNTTNDRVPVGAIPKQIKYALDRLPKARHLKLYNSGNFFDSKAIPPEDFDEIAGLVNNFDTLIVECHPTMIRQKVVEFNQLIKPDLQVAMGLETIHPEILPLLNKKMTKDDFSKAAGFLRSNKILTRAFILMGLPFLTEDENVDWAKKSIDFAFETGVECCSVIPTRTGNGALDEFQTSNHFQEPSLSSLLEVVGYGLNLQKGRVFGDTWDLKRFVKEGEDGSKIQKKLEEMNYTQSFPQ